MKFVERRPFADPEDTAPKLLELANSAEPVQDGRIHIEKINWPFLSKFKGSPDEYRAGLKLAIERGWLWMDESGTSCGCATAIVQLSQPPREIEFPSSVAA
jgi:hypothetical protein